MSTTELHYGKLLKLELVDITLEAACKEACTRLGDFDVLQAYYECWADQLKYGHHDKYFVHDGQMYGILQHHESEDGDYFMKLYESKGSNIIDFIGEFYNGGTCFNEMLEEALDNLKLDNQKKELNGKS